MLPREFKLAIPYISPLESAKNPFSYSSCASMAMALEYLGVKPHHAGKPLEDDLLDWLNERELSRQNPYDLVKAIKGYGCKDHFKTDATIEEVKEWIAVGNPAVIHGYFTPSGQVVCVTGYTPAGFIVNDPCGEYGEDGYDISARGAGLTYSYGLIERICRSDGDFWVHFISK